MMKKAIKKLLAALLAVAMVCAMAIPAFAYDTEETEEDLNKNHGYIAFQIFTGVISKDNPKLSDVDWGKHITKPDDFLKELKLAPTIGNEFKDADTPQDVLAVISQWSDSDDDSIAFARFVCHYLYSNGDPESSIVGGGGAIKIPEPGYYLIVDNIDIHEDDFYHAYNSFLLVNVTQGEYNVIINHKVVKPTVEKEVHDNDNNDISSAGNNDGWGSSADHAINEKFQFRLIAKLPASKDNGRAYDYYDKYTVCFNDTLSKGITFDNLDRVEITNGDGGDPKEITDYTLDKDLHEAGLPSSFKLSIDDVKTCVPDLNKGATITVTYTAHLNDKAAVNTADGASNGENKNSVYLQYSNNPRINTSLDWTPTSEVRVYTYQLNNTKYHDDDNSDNVLAGAGFRLYSDKACNEAQEIKLKKNTDGTYSRYFGTEAGDEMISGNDGQFNVKGLDAGTYYLKETKTPDGYSACDKTEIVISATHDVYHVSLSGNLSNKIINKKAGGITLPSTGGIGTTLFYVVGGGLMVAAIVLLVTKKRMENK